MKIIRSIVGACIFIEIIWMVFFVIPTTGVFRSLPDDPPVPMNGPALVMFKERIVINSIPLSRVKTGWSAIGEGWSLIFFGLLLGYPIGEFARRKLAIDAASKNAIQLSEKYTKEAVAKEINANRILKEAQTIHADYPRIKKELAEAQAQTQGMTNSREFLLQEYGDLRRKKESVEKELEKARAKIRRLIEKDKNRIGKAVDEDLISG